MNMKVKPLRDNVLVEPSQPQEKTIGGILIPDNAKEKPQHGKVHAVGPGTKDDPMHIKVGDQVIYSKYSGTELEIDGAHHLIMRQSDIYAVLE